MLGERFIIKLSRDTSVNREGARILSEHGYLLSGVNKRRGTTHLTVEGNHYMPVGGGVDLTDYLFYNDVVTMEEFIEIADQGRLDSVGSNVRRLGEVFYITTSDDEYLNVDGIQALEEHGYLLGIEPNHNECAVIHINGGKYFMETERVHRDSIYPEAYIGVTMEEFLDIAHSGGLINYRSVDDNYFGDDEDSDDYEERGEKFCEDVVASGVDSYHISLRELGRNGTSVLLGMLREMGCNYRASDLDLNGFIYYDDGEFSYITREEYNHAPGIWGTSITMSELEDKYCEFTGQVRSIDTPEYKTVKALYVKHIDNGHGAGDDTIRILGSIFDFTLVYDTDYSAWELRGTLDYGDRSHGILLVSNTLHNVLIKCVRELNGYYESSELCGSDE